MPIKVSKLCHEDTVPSWESFMVELIERQDQPDTNFIFKEEEGLYTLNMYTLICRFGSQAWINIYSWK